jgi:hypothetical protein
MTRLSTEAVLGRSCRALAPLRGIVTFTVFLVAACGSMTVQVDVIDPAYVETVTQKAHLQSQLREAFRPTDEKNVKYEAIREDLDRGFEQMIDLARQDAERERLQGRVAEADAARAAADALSAAKEQPLSEFVGLTSKLTRLDEQIRQAVAQAGTDVTAPPLSNLLLERQATAEAAVEKGLELLGEIAQLARGESLGGPTPLMGQTRTAAIGPLARSQVEADLKSITGGFTLAESGFAYAVASAPDERWAKQFNRTFGRGTFGNLNFAVKMVSLADFTIKGVTFDPSKVAQVASKVTTQSLLLAAQIAGVPVTGLSIDQAQTGGALAAQSAELAETLESNQRFAAQEELRQKAIAAILARIAEEANNLSGTEAQRTEAIRAIAATYSAYKGLLRYSS